MNIGSAIAVFFLIFVFTAFLLLPFGVRTDEEVGAERVPGQAESAPHRFDLTRHLMRSAVMALVVFCLWYINWVEGFVSYRLFDWYH